MTANLTITIDERNNVLKVPNSALRFTPQDANSSSALAQVQGGQGQGQGQGQGRRRQQGDNASGDNGGENRFAPASAPVLAGSGTCRLGAGPGRQARASQNHHGFE